jgi:hypothetical protein
VLLSKAEKVEKGNFLIFILFIHLFIVLVQDLSIPGKHSNIELIHPSLALLFDFI